MELNSDLLELVFGGNNGAGAGSPELPKKAQSQSVDTDLLNSSLVTDPTAPVEPPKP
tara:strand:- start:145 stop:315 length:171 start_codon:yes stop_codon:yes gene_type:complete